MGVAIRLGTPSPNPKFAHIAPQLRSAPQHLTRLHRLRGEEKPWGELALRASAQRMGALRKVNVERVNLLGADIADEERRAAGGQAAPSSQGTYVAPQTGQAKKRFGAGLTNPHPAK